MQYPLYFLSSSKATSHVAVPEIFAGQPNMVLLTQAIRVYQANLRQQTRKTKTRAEVAMTKAKWFKQKGTGRARHGAQSAPQFVGGGVAHGPTGHEQYHLALSGVLKHKALIAAMQAQQKQITIVDGVGADHAKTAVAKKALQVCWQPNQTALMVMSDVEYFAARGLANFAKLQRERTSQVHALSVAKAKNIILTQTALAELVARLSVVKPAAQPAAKPTKSTQAAKSAKAVAKPAKPAKTANTAKSTKSTKVTATTKPKKNTKA